MELYLYQYFQQTKLHRTDDSQKGHCLMSYSEIEILTGSARLHKLTVSIVDKIYSMNNSVLISQKRQCPFKFLEMVILSLIVSSKIVSYNYDQAFRADNNSLEIWKGRLGHVYQFCLFFLYYIIIF